jgi:hypothetical protein
MDTKKLRNDINFILKLPPINEGVEWFSNENWFDVIAEIVLVRQTPIEVVTSAVVALKMSTQIPEIKRPTGNISCRSLNFYL